VCGGSQLTTNNKVVQNNQQGQAFESLKAMRTTTIKDASALLTEVKSAKKRIFNVTQAIDQKQKSFAEQAKVVETQENVEQPKIVEEVKEQKSTVVPAEEKPVAQPVAEEKPASKGNNGVNIEITYVKPLIDQQPKDQKVFIDDKGNKIVRKFITDRFPQKPAQPQGQQQQRGQQQRGGFNNNQGGRQQGQRKPFDPNRPRPQFDKNRNFNDKDKDDNKTNTPKPAQKPKTFAGDLPVIPKEPQGKNFGNKNKTPERSDSKKQMSKKDLLKKGYINQGNANDYDEEFVTRKLKVKKQEIKKEAIKIEKAVINTQEVQIKVLSEKIGVTAAEIIKQLFKEGIMKTINDSVDFDYAAYIASNFGVELTLELDKSAEELMMESFEQADSTLADDQKRPPIVTVLGHVDHGKTSLLDAIRKTSVTSGEAGGITQHIGAYTVEAKGEPITFIDTPGHAAFTAMRARGAQMTDVAILVVAADDGVMPQTIEALNHAKAAGVPIIVAVNKMDKNEANPDRVKQQLTEHGILPEEWGGDSIFVPVSAKAGTNIDKLLEAVLLVAEMSELKANPEKAAKGTIVEAKLDKGRGPVATILVQNGTLHVGDYIVAGTAIGKIRAMFNDKNKSVRTAGPSIPVEVLGLSEVPNAGDIVNAVDEKLAKQVADERKDKERNDRLNASSKVSLDDLFGKISEGQLKTLNLIIKADVQGSLEAIKGTVEKISNDEVKISPIHGGVGAINETDVMLAKASGAIVIGFNVRADAQARAAAEREQVDIRLYNIIYDMVDDITSAMKGMLAPKYRDTIMGQVEVREVFKITGVGAVAGSYVTQGKITRQCKVRVYRDNVIVYDGELLALKRFKDDVKEVAQGFECGVSIKNYNDIKVGDVFEAYLVEQIQE